MAINNRREPNFAQAVDIFEAARARRAELYQRLRERMQILDAELQYLCDANQVDDPVERHHALAHSPLADDDEGMHASIELRGYGAIRFRVDRDCMFHVERASLDDLRNREEEGVAWVA